MQRVLNLATALAACAALLPSPALAQETVDVGVLKNSEISVVQKLLYPKKDKQTKELHFACRYTFQRIPAFAF